ncbi:hypothetical protein ACJ73_08903 [Blastomyces percursus]|uniref:Uncharacterized protein n=1 Tax=Blastomyces percursus TaxID=1658174 RepID=A0A1J9QJ14_9EURO|nr:hypothetical protein ACJ73_08903 [Blastomyces percursus]
MALPSNSVSLALTQTLQMAALNTLPPHYLSLLRMFFLVFQRKSQPYILLALFAAHTSITCWRHIRNVYFATMEIRYNDELFEAVRLFAEKNSTGVSHVIASTRTRHSLALRKENDENNSDIDSGDEEEDFDT